MLFIFFRNVDGNNEEVLGDYKEYEGFIYEVINMDPESAGSEQGIVIQIWKTGVCGAGKKCPASVLGQRNRIIRVSWEQCRICSYVWVNPHR